MNKKEKTLLIVAGAAGEIGLEFIKESIRKEINSVAIIRNKHININSKYVEVIKCNLDESADVEESFSLVDFTKYQNIIYLHTIGVDKFNPRNYPDLSKMKTIDPDIYDTNVNSFKYLLRYVSKSLFDINKENKENIRLKIVAITGTSDKYTPFVIEDFCEAKFIIREYIRSYVSRFPTWISGLSINVSSTLTASALAVRPFADTKFWLKPKDIVEKSDSEFYKFTEGYKEVEVIKHSPLYVEGYYENKDLLYKKWSAETGVVSKNPKATN